MVWDSGLSLLGAVTNTADLGTYTLNFFYFYFTSFLSNDTFT